MAIENQRHPCYSGEYFVDRQNEIKLVLDKVHSLLNGEEVHRRTTAFYGPRGAGKSWLVCELRRSLDEQPELQGPVIPLLLVLGDPSTVELNDDCCHIPASEAETLPIRAVERALGWVHEQLELGACCGLGLDELSTRVVEGCRQKGCPIVILVDGIDEVPPSFLREFESYLLAPLAQEPRVLFVLGGRTRDPRPSGGYTWRTPELKLGSHEHYLEPFDEAWTREQLAQLADEYPVTPAAAPKAKDAGAGYPLSNVVLAQHIEGDPPAWRDKGAALRQCAGVLLERVDNSLRDHFWALCVFRAFDEDRMPALLAPWFGGDETAWNYQRCHRIRMDMGATRLVRWKSGQGFVMDEAVRAVLENALLENDRERWRSMHLAAKELYLGWVELYPTARERWQPEADYHAQRLGEGEEKEGEHGES